MQGEAVEIIGAHMMLGLRKAGLSYRYQPEISVLPPRIMLLEEYSCLRMAPVGVWNSLHSFCHNHIQDG